MRNNMSQNESETQESISAKQKLKQRTYTYSDMLDARGWWKKRWGEKCKDSTADLNSRQELLIFLPSLENIYEKENFYN